MMATYTCGNERCIRLEHLASVSRRSIQLRINQNYNAADKLAKSAKIIVKARARAKMTMEKAKEIRALDLPQREIARRYGIAQSTVGTIKRGTTWIDHTNPFLRLAA
jgi:predicted XRE-type DNA-binding protein